MNRPYIICHMTTSIDGKVTGDFLYKPECIPSIDHYYEINRNFRGDAFACGRITMEGSFTGGWRPDYTPFAGAPISREDYIADSTARFFAVAFDRQGRLGWKASHITDEDPGYDNAHIVEVLCENTPDEHLAYFRSVGVSYIFAGKTELNLSLALAKLKILFGIEKLLLEGGSAINCSFQQENAIDELSLVIAPLTASAEDKPLFECSQVQHYQLINAQTLGPNTLWIRYKNI